MKLRGLGAAVLAGAAAVLGYVAQVVAGRTIDVVQASRLLPRWDLATHLVHGWLDYHLLATGQVHRLLWDLWLQGYWPPAHSIYQVPFYLALGGGMSSGLRSSLVAFVLVGLTGSAILWRQWKSVLPVSFYLALLISSPVLLAYASVTMTEMVGALAQLLVLLGYQRYRERPDSRTARLFAASLTILFFTKYNYFFLLAAPLVLHEWLDRTSGWTAGRRVAGLWQWARRLLSTPTGALVAVYLGGLLAVVLTGGFDVVVFGRRIAVHTIGNSGHVVLYLLLGRLWWLHRAGRLDWDRLISADPRIRPLLVWFVVPVTIWLTSPYPNHIRDFANLVINRPLGESTVGAGIATYVDALRTTYFYREWILWTVAAIAGLAALRYRRQPPLMQVLILAIPLQLAAIALHQTRFPRFLLLSVVLLCLSASAEVGRWLAGAARAGAAANLLAPAIVVWGVLAARQVVAEERFRAFAFEHYTASKELPAALDSVRGELTGSDRLAIVGQSNDLSPGLFRWQLGPPSGAPCFPLEVAGASRPELGLATRILLIAPLGPDAPAIEMTDAYLAERRVVQEQAGRGELALRREIQVHDMGVVLRLYDRPTRPQRQGACR